MDSGYEKYRKHHGNGSRSGPLGRRILEEGVNQKENDTCGWATIPILSVGAGIESAVWGNFLGPNANQYVSRQKRDEMKQKLSDLVVKSD